MNIKIYSQIFTKGIGIFLITTMNTFSVFPAFAQQPDCSNYWTNPNTGETECFGSEMNLIAEPEPVSSQANPLSYRSSSSESYDLGGKEITIPTPDKYVRVTRKMDTVYRLHRHMEDPLNDFLASYISQPDAAIAMEGELPLIERGFALKMGKVFKEMSVDSQNFAEIKNEIKTYNKNISASEESKLREIINETGEGVSNELGIDFALNLSQIIPLEPHDESANILSYSLYMIYEVSGVVAEEEYILAATATLINVSGKVISLYSYGTQSDLEWTRSSSKAWSKKVTASNK